KSRGHDDDVAHAKPARRHRHHPCLSADWPCLDDGGEVRTGGARAGRLVHIQGTSMFVQVNGARLFFDTVGSKFVVDGERMIEQPSLIVMHGGPGFDHSTLRPYFDRFADTHQVIYIDHRGNGRSGGDKATWTLAQWGDDVKALCDALGIQKPVVYGNS